MVAGVFLEFIRVSGGCFSFILVLFYIVCRLWCYEILRVVFLVFGFGDFWRIFKFRVLSVV